MGDDDRLKALFAYDEPPARDPAFSAAVMEKIMRRRFLADSDIPKLYDARFRRMWEFYLAGAEMGFRYGTHMIMQIQLTRRIDTLPVTRDYLAGT